MQFLPYLLAFVAGGLFTIAVDKTAGKMRTRKITKAAHQRNLMMIKLEAEGWQRPWLS